MKVATAKAKAGSVDYMVVYGNILRNMANALGPMPRLADSLADVFADQTGVGFTT